jgi:hypothetical protein
MTRAIETSNRARTLGWPRLPERILTSGVDHLSGELVMPDGRVVSLDNPQLSRSIFALSAQLNHALPDGTGLVTLFAPEGDTLKIYVSVGLTDGAYVDPPVFTLPAGGGSQTQQLPGGGSITLTIDGAHPLTEAEQAAADRINNAPPPLPRVVAAPPAAGAP